MPTAIPEDFTHDYATPQETISFMAYRWLERAPEEDSEVCCICGQKDCECFEPLFRLVGATTKEDTTINKNPDAG